MKRRWATISCSAGWLMPSITGRSAKSQLVRVNVARPRKILKSGYACSMKKLASAYLRHPPWRPRHYVRRGLLFLRRVAARALSSACSDWPSLLLALRNESVGSEGEGAATPASTFTAGSMPKRLSSKKTARMGGRRQSRWRVSLAALLCELSLFVLASHRAISNCHQLRVRLTPKPGRLVRHTAKRHKLRPRPPRCRGLSFLSGTYPAP